MRRQIVVDKNFQLKISLIGMSAVLLMLVIVFAAVGVSVWKNDVLVDKTVSKLGDTITDQNHVIQSLNDYTSIKKKDEQRIASRILSNNLNENNDLLKKNILFMQEISRNNRIVFWILFVFIIAQSCLLFVMLLRWTLRIAGPVHVMTRNIQNVLDGKVEEFRPIRNNDELRDLYGLVAELALRYQNGKTSGGSVKSSKATPGRGKTPVRKKG